MKYFPAAGRYRTDAVAIVAGCRPYLDLCESKKTFFFSPLLIKTGLLVHTLKALRMDVKQLQFQVRAGIQWCEMLQDQSDTK